MEVFDTELRHTEAESSYGVVAHCSSLQVSIWFNRS